MAWLEATDVQNYLELDEIDDRVEMATAAVKSEVERLRSDLNFSGSAQIAGSVKYGAILWAALFYQQRNAPSGFAGYGDGADIVGDVLGSKKADIYRFIGLRRPVTA
jgi:hypothetical protein